MATEKAKALARKLREERKAKEKVRDEDYELMTKDEICPDCAVPVLSKFWSDPSAGASGIILFGTDYVCPQCGRSARATLKMH